MLSTRNSLQIQRHSQIEVKEWKTCKQQPKRTKRVGEAILITDKKDLNTENVTQDKEGHYVMIKRPIHQKDCKHL